MIDKLETTHPGDQKDKINEMITVINAMMPNNSEDLKQWNYKQMNNKQEEMLQEIWNKTPILGDYDHDRLLDWLTRKKDD